MSLRPISEFAAGLDRIVAEDRARCVAKNPGAFNDCPPAGASQEVNEAAQLGSSVASGQRAGILYRALCQDCLYVQSYATDLLRMAAHDELSLCERCGTGVMCACLGCLAHIEVHSERAA